MHISPKNASRLRIISYLKQQTTQEETRRNIISDMVNKRSMIVPIIGDNTIVYKENETTEEVPFQEFIVRAFQKKYPQWRSATMCLRR